MKREVGMLVIFLSAMSCVASEIVAWKVPLSSYAERGLESEGIVRLKSPPEASPFFKAGDELWDLSGIPATDKTLESVALELESLRIVTDPPLEWAVWNASSRQLVTKGDWNSIWQLHQELRVDQLPKQFRLRLEVMGVPADGADLSETAEPFIMIEWVTQSGREFTVSRQMDSGVVRVEGCATGDELDRVFDLKLKVVARPAGNHPQVDFITNLTMWTGYPAWVARDFNGRSGWDFRAFGRVELIDGTPLESAVQIQKDTSIGPLEESQTQPIRHRIGKHGWLMTACRSTNQLDGFLQSVVGSPTQLNPFASESPETVRELLKVNEVKVPEYLKTWFPRKVWDLNEKIKAAGIEMGDLDFAGYDPFSKRIFLFVANEEELGKFELLLDEGWCHPPRAIIVKLEGNGQTRLVCRSGEKCCLSRSVNGRVVRSVNMEPVIGADENILDLFLDYHDESIPTRQQTFKSSLVLRNEQILEVLGSSERHVENSPLRVKVAIESLVP